VELLLPRHTRSGRVVRAVTCDMKVDDPQINQIIRLAWEDRTTFEEIKKRTGYSEADVIKVMRRHLKPSSFRRWRKRVNGRITKHRKRFEKEVLRRSDDDLTH